MMGFAKGSTHPTSYYELQRSAEYQAFLLPSLRARSAWRGGVGGASATSLAEGLAERPPTPDPSPPLRGGRGEKRAPGYASLIRPTAKLRHAARHEAADIQTQGRPDRPMINRPHHRSRNPVRFRDHGFVRNVPPLAFDADAIVAVFCFPVDIRQRGPICVGTARALA